MTVSYKEYNEEFVKFVKKHNEKSECRIYTSPLDNDIYHKEYFWEDGAAWYERTELITETHEIQSHGLSFKVDVEMWRTEFWSSENSKSRYYYCV